MICKLSTFEIPIIENAFNNFISKLNQSGISRGIKFNIRVDTSLKSSATIRKTRDNSYTILFSVSPIDMASKDRDCLDAALILMGHEIAHKVWPNAHGVWGEIKKETSNQLACSLLSICHEVYADIKGRDLYSEYSCKPVSPAVAQRYAVMCYCPQDSKAIKLGYLQANYRGDMLLNTYNLVGNFNKICKIFTNYWKIQRGVPPTATIHDPRLVDVYDAISEVQQILNDNNWLEGRLDR